MTTTPVLMLSPSFCGGVLIASPSAFLREQVLHSFDDSGRPVHQARGGAEALVKLDDGDWPLLFLDRRLPDLDAEELIQIIRLRFPGIEVVLLDSDSGQPLSAVTPGFAADRKVERVVSVEPERTARPFRRLPQVTPVEPLPGMIDTAEPMQSLYRLVRLVAPRRNDRFRYSSGNS